MHVLFTPGGGVRSVNCLEETSTLERLFAGWELWKSGRFDKWVVSGSCCHPPHIQTIATADLSAQWALTRGGGYSPRPDQLIVLRNAHDSWSEARDLMHELGQITASRPFITVVSGLKHCRRFWWTFHYGYDTNISLHPTARQLRLTESILEDMLFQITKWDPKGEGWIAEWNRQRRTYPTPVAAGRPHH